MIGLGVRIRPALQCVRRGIPNLQPPTRGRAERDHRGAHHLPGAGAAPLVHLVVTGPRAPHSHGHTPKVSPGSAACILSSQAPGLPTMSPAIVRVAGPRVPRHETDIELRGDLPHTVPHRHLGDRGGSSLAGSPPPPPPMACARPRSCWCRPLRTSGRTPSRLLGVHQRSLVRGQTGGRLHTTAA